MGGRYMTVATWTLIFAVGLLNIAFNVNARIAASAANSWYEGLFTFRFFFYFLIGFTSLLALYTLYFQGIALPRAILLMGAISIIGGTVYGLIKGQRLDNIELSILLALVALFFYRLLIK